MNGPVTIGNATLYCGDCLEILPTLTDSSVDMVFMDPPYGHNNNNGDLIHNIEKALGRSPSSSSTSRPIANDGAEANPLFRAAIDQFPRLLSSSGCCCCCCSGGGGPDPQFARWALWLDEVLTFKQMIIWDKGPMGLGWHYRRSYETVLVAHKGQKCNWYEPRSDIENIIRPGQYGIKKIIPSAADHPTLKPTALAAHFIRLHSKPRDSVLDPFMGSGTTGVACMDLGRRFIGIEIDRRYFDLACRRIDAAQRQARLFA